MQSEPAQDKALTQPVNKKQSLQTIYIKLLAAVLRQNKLLPKASLLPHNSGYRTG
jgi:hypothetical protein